jgi:hypothetical protein
MQQVEMDPITPSAGPAGAGFDATYDERKHLRQVVQKV